MLSHIMMAIPVSYATLTLVTNRNYAKRRCHQWKSAVTKERWKDLAKQVQAPYLYKVTKACTPSLFSKNRGRMGA